MGIVKRLTAHLAAHQVQALKIVPVIVVDQVLELHRIIRADPLAVTAADTAGHVVRQGPLTVQVSGPQRGCRTVFHTGHAAVAPVVYLKISHCTDPLLH